MKATLNTTQILAFIIIISFSCQKEFSRENHIAKGTLKDPSGTCFISTIHGAFYNGLTPNGNTAYVEVKVNVTATGSYSIFTDTQNGLRFADSGIFKNAGINIIKLKLTGTPVIHKPTYLVIRFDTSVCSLTINVLDSENEKVKVVNINNGERPETYVIKGKRGSVVSCLNGPAARKVAAGDVVVIISYTAMDFEEAKNFYTVDYFS